MLKYPDDWIIQTQIDVKDKFYSFDALGKGMTLSKTILEKNGHEMIIFSNFSGPISEEPQICVYPDSQIDSGMYAPLRFSSDMITIISEGGYRRSILNEYLDQTRFEICRPRENLSTDNIIFEPAHISYLTPKKYDFQILSEMDQILSTFKFLGVLENAADVKFKKGVNLDTPENLIPQKLQGSIISIKPLFTLPESEINKLKAGDLKLWYRVELKKGVDVDNFINQLKLSNNIEVVEVAPSPQPLP